MPKIPKETKEMNEVVKIGCYEAKKRMQLGRYEVKKIGIDSSNGMIQRFQRSSLPASAPFQHVVLSSNPIGIQKGVGRKA